MNKRQKKKNEKKYLPIIADEFNLVSMTEEEREKACIEFNKFRERFAYRKKYKDLKNGKALVYYYPPGEKVTNFIENVSNIARKTRKLSTRVVTQTLDDFQDS